MIRTAVFAIIAVALISAVFGQNADHHLTETRSYGLKGRVKSVVIERFKIKKKNGQRVETDTKIDSRRQFDESGNLTSTEIYSNGLLWTRISFFHTNGAIARKIETFDMKTGHILSNHKKGSRAAVCAETSGFDLRTEYTTNAKMLKTAGISFDGCGGLFSKSVFAHSANGSLERLIETFDPGARTTEFEYDKDGNLIRKSISGLLTQKYSIYEFDKNGNWILRVAETHMAQIGPILGEQRETFRERQTIAYY